MTGKRNGWSYFLEEVDTEYGDVLYHTAVHWLSRGEVLKRFMMLLSEIRAFMAEKERPVTPQDDAKLLYDLAFPRLVSQKQCNMSC
ncbi:GT2D2 protein, partial [Polyodon spathula]|nr:GT2D2 protein [Polyodon spathula]